MIKFFRKIRQQLLSQNRFSKYLLYAIGEIILVMVGILLALQVNNWNEERKFESLEQNYIISLLFDLHEQINTIDKQALSERQYIDTSELILTEYFTNHNLNIDYGLMKNLTYLTFRNTFVINDPTYTDLVSSGKLSILSNDELRNDLIQYYQKLERVEKVIQNNNTLFTDQEFLPVIMSKAFIVFDTDQLERDYTESDGIKDLSNQKSEEMMKVSQKVLLAEENKLLLINSVSIRNERALRHFQWLNILKKETQILIEKLQKYQEG